MRLLLGGGGTGGHIFPALAVTRALEDHISTDLDVLFVGTATGIEAEIVPDAGFAFKGVAARGMRGRNAVSMAWSLGTTAAGVWDATQILRRFRPSVVLVTGGFASVPVGIAAWLLRVPLVVFQPDIEPGWANRVLSRLATRICVSDAQSIQRLPARRTVATGYPLRPVFREIDRPMARARFGLNGSPAILVTGAVRGARQINRAIEADLDRWIDIAQVIHVTGEQDARRLQARRNALPEEKRHRYLPFEYLGDELPMAMAACDLAISRAGASVLAEYPAAGLASVLVPLPGAGGHQRHNAQVLADAGAAVIVQDQAVRPQLLNTASQVLANPERLSEMRRSASARARLDSADRIAEVLWEVRRD